MITVVNENTYDFRGLSTDKKPIDKIGNGSIFLEIDTSRVYMFDAQNKIWYEIGVE